MTAYCEENAILKIRCNAFDVIFFDWKLADLSGLDLLNYVRRNEAEIGFIIATPYSKINHAVQTLQQALITTYHSPLNVKNYY